MLPVLHVSHILLPGDVFKVTGYMYREVGRGERSAQGLRLLSRPRLRSSRRHAGCVLVGLDGCVVRLCDPCALVRPRER